MLFDGKLMRFLFYLTYTIAAAIEFFFSNYVYLKKDDIVKEAISVHSRYMNGD